MSDLSELGAVAGLLGQARLSAKGAKERSLGASAIHSTEDRHSAGQLARQYGDADLRCLFEVLGCDKTFIREASFRAHIFSHFRGNSLPHRVSCFGCGRLFPEWGQDDTEDAWDDLLNHMVDDHYRSGKPDVVLRPDPHVLHYMWEKGIITYVETSNMPEISQPSSKDAIIHTESDQARDADYWEYLIKPDKSASQQLEQLCLSLAKIVCDLEPGPTDRLTPQRLAKFYRTVDGDLDGLFLRTSSSYLSLLYRRLGCFHTLEASSNPFEAPAIPSLTPDGFVKWQNINLLLCPKEYAGYLRKAVATYDVPHPDGGHFPSTIPDTAFPDKPDPVMESWHLNVVQRVNQLNMFTRSDTQRAQRSQHFRSGDSGIGSSVAESEGPFPTQLRLPSRMRYACWTCRARKVRCDENRPVCSQCSRLGHACDYAPRLSYRDDSSRLYEMSERMISTDNAPRPEQNRKFKKSDLKFSERLRRRGSISSCSSGSDHGYGRSYTPSRSRASSTSEKGDIPRPSVPKSSSMDDLVSTAEFPRHSPRLRPSRPPSAWPDATPTTSQKNASTLPTPEQSETITHGDRAPAEAAGSLPVSDKLSSFHSNICEVFAEANQTTWGCKKCLANQLSGEGENNLGRLYLWAQGLDLAKIENDSNVHPRLKRLVFKLLCRVACNLTSDVFFERLEPPSSVHSLHEMAVSLARRRHSTSTDDSLSCSTSESSIYGTSEELIESNHNKHDHALRQLNCDIDNLMSLLPTLSQALRRSGPEVHGRVEPIDSSTAFQSRARYSLAV